MEKYYHAPDLDKEVTIGHTVQPQPGWVRITKAQCEQIQEHRRAGARIYLDANQTPRPFYQTPKPTVKWNEMVTKSPFVIIGGIAREDWTTTKLPLEEQYKILKTRRLIKQETGQIAIADGTVFPTDSWTATVMIEADKDYQKGVNITRNWKVRDGLFIKVTNAQLSEALVLIKAHIQKHFDIEAYYTELVNTNVDFDIDLWAIPTETPEV